jgi:hypothetical protein
MKDEKVGSKQVRSAASRTKKNICTNQGSMREQASTSQINFNPVCGQRIVFETIQGSAATLKREVLSFPGRVNLGKP